jgi:hypothetical protein
MSRRTDRRRRRLLLALAGASAGLAGCLGGGGDDDLAGPVPEQYRTATALNGDRRDPDAVRSKAGVNYHAAQGSAQCSNCAFYIPDENGDGLGACTLVEGYIEPGAWCSVYAPYEGSGAGE